MGAGSWRPWQSLTWEYVSRGKWTLATVTLACWTLAALYHRAMEPLGARRDGIVFISIFFTLLIVSALAFASCREDQKMLGFEQRLFRLPWPTWKIVLARLAPAVVGSGLLYLSVVVFMRQMFAVRWPTLGPALLVATATGWTLALLWTLGHRPILLAPAGLALGALTTGWLAPFLRQTPDPVAAWRAFGAAHLGLTSLLLSAAVVVATVGVTWHRGSTRRPFRIPWAARNRHRPRLRASFPSTTAAILWRDWREKGRFLLLQATAALGVTGFLAVFPAFDLQRLDRGVFALAQFLVLAGPWMAGFMYGRSSVSSAEPELDLLRATLPVSDRAIGWHAQAGALLAVLTSWTILPCAGLLLAGVAASGTAAANTVTLRAAHHLFAATSSAAGGPVVGGALLVLVLLCWAQAASGLVATVVLTGRNWVVVTLAVLPLALLLGALVFDRITGAGALDVLVPRMAFAAAMLVPLATIAGAVFCISRRSVPPRTVVRLLLLWAGLSLLTWLRVPELRPEGGPLTLLLVASLSALIAPWLLSPLATAWNRHR